MSSERDELAAVEGDHHRQRQPSSGRDGGDARHPEIRVQEVDAPARRQRGDGVGQPPPYDHAPEPRRAHDAAEVMDRRPGQRVHARLAIMMKHEHVHVVTPGEPFDQPDDARQHPFTAGAIDAAGHDETDAHAHQHLTREGV